MLALLVSTLRELLGLVGVLFALHVVAFAVMFGRSAMRFGGTLMMFSCLIVFVPRHRILRLVFK